MGNLNSYRDWGFAGDYVEAMWKILQHDEPDDWVVATGETHSVEEFAEQAFSYVELNHQVNMKLYPGQIKQNLSL